MLFEQVSSNIGSSTSAIRPIHPHTPDSPSIHLPIHLPIHLHLVATWANALRAIREPRFWPGSINHCVLISLNLRLLEL